jgi:hypothetical protein
MEIIGLFLPAAGDGEFRGGHLRFAFQFGVAGSFPAKFAGFGWLPLPLRIRHRRIGAEP